VPEFKVSQLTMELKLLRWGLITVTTPRSARSLIISGPVGSVFIEDVA
jgi:hypothetical protein